MNPYNITEVDIPGVVGAVQNARMGRIQQMLGERQIAAADRQAERDNQFNTTLARIFAPQTSEGGVRGAYGGPTTAGTPAVTPPGLPGPSPAPVASQAPTLDPALAAQLIALDPQQGAQVVHALQQADAARLARISAANDYLARAAQHLLSVPQAERAAEIQRIAPDLMSHGITQEQIAGFDSNDRNLQYVVGQAQDIDHLIANARGHPMSVQAGGSVIDTDNIDPATGRPRILYESPYVMGPGGVPYTRPPGMSANPPHPLTDEDIRRMDQGGPTRTGSETFP